MRHWSQHQCCRSKKPVHGLQPHACAPSQHHVLLALRASRSTPTFHSRIPSPTSSIIDTDATSQFLFRHYTWKPFSRLLSTPTATLKIILHPAHHSNTKSLVSTSCQRSTRPVALWVKSPARRPWPPSMKPFLRSHRNHLT